jgi:hypothetical protein
MIVVPVLYATFYRVSAGAPPRPAAPAQAVGATG